MNPKEFSVRAAAAIGHGWKRRMARACGVAPSTVYRWSVGAVTVPEYAVAIVELIEWHRASGARHLPQRFDRG